MNVSLALILLLAGASGERNGVAFQAQLGYMPSFSAKKDYRRGVVQAGLPNPEGMFYFSHSITGKLGIETRNGWRTGIAGSIASYTLTDANSNLRLPADSVTQEPWISMSVGWKSTEYSIGADVGHSFGSARQWNVSTGLVFTWGKLSGTDTLWKYNHETNDEDVRVINVTSPVRGLQWHIGAGIPILSLNQFSLQINPTIKGGFIKEQSTDIPPEAEWKGPFTLSKWGAGLGLTLNYNGVEQK